MAHMPATPDSAGLMSSADKTKSDAITDTGSGVILTAAERTDIADAKTHVASDGSNHGFLNQGVMTSNSPTFAGVTLTDDATLKDGTTTVDGGLAFDRTDEDLSIGDGSASRIVHMGEWKTWTPVFTGFTSAPTIVAARYTQIGKLVIAFLNMNNATSNATTFTVTLPVAASGVSKQFLLTAVVTNNGIANTMAGLMKTRLSSAVADLFVDTSSAAWVASGAKRTDFMVMYESI